MKGIILCAGRGERLRPLTDTIPKPMVLVGNKPLLEYHIQLLKKYGVTEIAINTSYLPEKIKNYLGNGEKFGVKIIYSFEPTLLGTSGALKNFKDFIDEPFFVIYGDELTNINLEEVAKFHSSKKCLATLCVRENVNGAKKSSLITLEENSIIKRFIEKPSEEEFNKFLNVKKFLNSGIYLCEKEILDYIPDGFSDFAYDIFPKIISAGKKLSGFQMDQYLFRDVGTIERYNSLKEDIASGKVKLNF